MQPNLTVLIGENNSGKTNIVDSIRLLTLPLSGRRERYPEDDDLQRGSADSYFLVEGHYSGMSDTIKGLLISAVPDPTIDEAIMGMRYQVCNSTFPRGKTIFYASRYETAEVEPGATELIRHVFLPPLRDARQALGTGSATRIKALLEHFLTSNEETDEFIDYLKRAEAPHRVITAINTEIASTITSLTQGVRHQQATLGFSVENLSDVARDLRFRLADAGIPPEDIRSSGLGYANLLYIATVVVELAKARETDLTLFLVEEPEAHLHPQLQMLVLNFLLEQAKKSATKEIPAGHPEGHIQVIVTTHSPNLTAWIPPEHLSVVRSIRNEGQNLLTHHTISIPIATLGLCNQTLRKIGRYLDVTRSALLFGNKTILLEGIAEAILLPVFAKRFILSDDCQALQRFRGVLLTPIDGVDFEPYIEILLRPSNNETIADLVIVITDNDPKVRGDRKAHLEGLVTAWNVSQKLCVYTNAVTFEHELFKSGNEALLKKTFLTIHPNSAARWERDVENCPPEDRADAFINLMHKTKTLKGEFAQQLAAHIEDGDLFTVPDYLNHAIHRAAEL